MFSPHREHASALIIVLHFDHLEKPDRQSHEKLLSQYRVFESQFDKGPGCL